MNELREESQKDPETLEREIDRTRAEIGQTVDALTRKFSPGELVDQSLNLIRQNGREIAENLGHSIKQNPLPAVLTVVGLAWLMSANNRAPVYSSSSSTASLSGAKERLSSAGDRMKAGAANASERLASAKESVAGSMRDTASAARTHAQTQAAKAHQGFNYLLQEQPLILGALGLALGAALGAALPQTDVENRLVGETSDATKAQLKQVGNEAYHQAQDTAKQLADKGREAVAEESSSVSA